MVYHSQFNTETKVIGSLVVLPTNLVGEMVEETLDSFRPNIFFKNFDIQGIID